MTNWEYCTIALTSWDDALEKLAELGLDRWELVAPVTVTTTKPGGTSGALQLPDITRADQRMVLKRPLAARSATTRVKGTTAGY